MRYLCFPSIASTGEHESSTTSYPRPRYSAIAGSFRRNTCSAAQS